MAKIILKTKEQRVNELMNMFKLPSVDYSKGYQAKPRAELTGGSSTCSGLHAVNEIRKWYRRAIV